MPLQDPSPSVDAITEAPKSLVSPPLLEAPPGEEELRRKARRLLLLTFGVPYVLFVFWCLSLSLLLPDAAGRFSFLVPAGVASSLLGAALLIGFAALGSLRILQAKDATPIRKKKGMLRIAFVVLPGILLSLVTPVLIAREPLLTMTIAQPLKAEDFVAPLSVTFDVSKAVEILQKRGMQPLKYVWDFDGDQKPNEETLEPRVTALYERQGMYDVAVKVMLTDSVRVIRKRLVIQKAVFTISPSRPVVDRPVFFSLAHLYPEPGQIQKVDWDFDADGKSDETTNGADVVHTFFATGDAQVTATVTLMNQAQSVVRRTISIFEPEPLPFAARIVSQPTNLVGSPPFGVVFQLDTKEPLKEASWNFGDGEEEAGGERVAHTYRKKGIYTATAKLRSQSGSEARLNQIVRVVDVLGIPDLLFDGTPAVRGNKIEEEIPVVIDLTPKTQLPLITFQWEAPDAENVVITEDTIRAVYRKQGSYTLTLLAEDPEGKALRLPIAVTVKPPSPKVNITMVPEGGTAPLLVRFDASETAIPGEEISGFEWVFGDDTGGTPQQRGAQVEHLFRRPGTYQIRAKAYTTSGQIHEATRTIVVRSQVLDACFTVSRSSGVAPLGVKFYSECSSVSGEMTFLWDFGDGWSSDLPDPEHAYRDPGVYDVTLTLKDAAGNGVTSDPLSITVEAP